MIQKFYLCVVVFLAIVPLWAQDLKRTNNAEINFVSEAPLELIKASSSNCQGILNTDTGEFAFRIFIKTFDGFNNPLQKEHFYENYMEVSLFPDATFSGKLIDTLDIKSEEKQSHRAKGDLKIHGVTKERIIDIQLVKKEDFITFNATFEVPLVDHNIEIPNIVRQKIAEKIYVVVKGELK